jgi:Transglycosylase SLT domain
MAIGKVNSQGAPLHKRLGPGTGYPVAGSISDGTTVNIVCQTFGEAETGQYGTTLVWDRLDDNTYVSDAYIYTDTNGLVAPVCGGPALMPTDQVGQWIMQALQDLNMPQELTTVGDLRIIIHYESGGDPNAVNNWDSNAAAGNPSKGLMQTTQTTFNEYKLPGHDNIFDPVANIIAGTRYASARYGGLDGVPGVRAVKAGQPYVGY